MPSNSIATTLKANLFKILISILAIILIAAESMLHPKVSKFIEKQINTQTEKLKLDVTFSDVDYGYFPPNVSLNNVSFKNDTTIAAADRVNLSLRVLPLLSGQFKAGHLIIDNLNASLKIPKQNKKANTDPKLDLELQRIYKLIPIEHILLSNSKLILLRSKDVFNLELEFLEFEKLFGKLQLEIKSKVDIRTEKFKENFMLNSKLRWQEKGFFISFFTLQKENSILQSSGFIKKAILEGKKITPPLFYKNITELRVSLNADLKEFGTLLAQTVPPKILARSQIKDYTGRVQASGYYFPDSQDGFANDKGSIKFKADNLLTPFASFKEIDFEGELSTQALKSEKLNVQLNDQSMISLNNLIVEKKDKAFAVSVDLKSDSIHVEDVIKSLNLKAGNLRVPVSLDTHCGGTIQKKILLKCKGSGLVKSFDIYNLKDGSELISTKNIKADFSAYIGKKGLNFDADLGYIDAKSKLKTDAKVNGTLDYISGFNVDFEASPLDLNFINTISGLKFYGQTALKGFAKGSSKWGTFQADLINQNFKLNKFFLGDSTGLISYSYPLLIVKGIKGQLLEYGNSYAGDFALNVEENTLDLDFLGQDISDQGLRTLFFDQFKLPTDIKFQSNLIVEAGGSTDINLMDLNLKTKASELNLFGEKFDSGIIELKGDQGKWKLEKGILSKQNSSVNARGTFDGLKAMDLRLVSNGLSFESSSFLKDLGVKITGPFDLTLNAKGPIDGPEAVGTLIATNTTGPGGNPLGSSNIGYRLFEDEFFFKGDVFNNSFVGEGYYPLTPNGKLSVDGNLKNFDTLNFLNFNADNSKNTHLYLNGKTSFSRKKNGAFKGNLENFRANLKTDRQQLLEIVQTGNGNLSKPISFKTIQQGDEASINFDVSKPSKKIMSFSGSLDIAFLQPLIPTCEFVSGKLKSDKLTWSRSSGVASSSGTARVDAANFKSDAFPYSFSKINSVLKASGNKLFISELTAYLSNTKVYGSGQIQSSKPASIDLDISYKDLNLEFPKKIFTTSNGNFKLSGDSIPLGISGSLLVKEGIFAAELIGSDGTQTVLPNKRLPTKILRSSAPPADLKNVKVIIRDRMKVINTEAEGFASGRLVANGNPTDPNVSGKIKLKPGFKINFQDNTFNVKEGLVDYKNTTVDAPELFIDASTDKITDNNDPLERSYLVRMLANGPPDSLNIDFTSQPALDEKQVVSLLTIGTVSTQSLGQEINAQEQATYSGFQFGSYLLQRNKAVKDLKKKTGIEIGVSSSLTSFGVSPKVEAKKGWTPKLSSSLSQTFGNQRNLEFKNEYKLNKKTSTVLGVQNNQTTDAAQLNNRRIRQGVIFDLGLQYKFEFD